MWKIEQVDFLFSKSALRPNRGHEQTATVAARDRSGAV